MDIDENAENMVIPLATLNSKQLKFLSQVSLDIRTTVSNLSLPGVSALSVLDATAIDCLKDLYYMLNSEDPLNAMPVRRHVLESKLPIDCLVPIAIAADTDPAASRNRKRWSLPTYQTLRLFSVLTLPISDSSELASPSQLDYLLLDLRFRLASHRKVLATFVSLLQYYVDRKSEKRAALLPAEDSKVEDARIDNILRFFGNILSSPRPGVGETIMERDRAVHLALVGSLVDVEFFSTLAVLFSSEDDSTSHYTDLVFLVAEIYGLAYRHTSPVQMVRALRFVKSRENMKAEAKEEPTAEEPTTAAPSVFDSVFNPDPNEDAQPQPAPNKTPAAHSGSGSRSSGLRDALLRERATVGGARAASVGARWTSRHSGGFTRAVRQPGQTKLQIKSVRNPNGVTRSGPTNLVISAKRAIQSTKVFNTKHEFQESIQVNSELLCLQSTKKRTALKDLGKKQNLPTVRHDLQEDGLKGLVNLTSEMLVVSFEFFIRELRGRILETRERAQADETDVLKKAERSYLTIVGSVVGFHREKSGKVYKNIGGNSHNEGSTEDSLTASQLHKNDMKTILATDFKIIKTQWKRVEGAIELESFQMVFGILADACSNLKEGSKEDHKISLIELATFSVLEMIKILQGMAAIVPKEIEEAEEGKQGDLTPRELALNTLEQLFEREAFLNAPADLAKLFNTKMFSFLHLANIVEMAHAFTAILLDERELSRITVAKKKKRPKKLPTAQEEDADYKPGKEDKDEDKDYVPPEKKCNGAETDKGKTPDAPKAPETTNKDTGNENDSGPSQTENQSSVPTSNGDLTSDSSPSEAKADKESSENAPVVEDLSKENDEKDTTAPKDRDKDGPAENEPEATESQKELSAVEKMLQADEEDMVKGETPKLARPIVVVKKPPPVSQVERMLQADEQAAEQGAPQPEYVRTLDGKQVDENALPGLPDDDNTDNEGEEDDEMMTEMESIGIVRRFASTKAIETLLMPLRAALCGATELSGKTFTTPEGSESITGPTIVAKSASVAWAIWRVAQLRERGALCGQFFSYGVLHLLGIALKAESDGLLKKRSVLAHVAHMGKDVTHVFFKWLNCNPGLMYDMFVVIDKTYSVSFARKITNENEPSKIEESKAKKKKGRGSKKDDNPADSDEYDYGFGDSDSDKEPEKKSEKTGPPEPLSPPVWQEDELLNSDDPDYDEEKILDRITEQRKKKVDERGQKRKSSNSNGIREDEDVDDLDNIQFGGLGKLPSDDGQARKRRKKSSGPGSATKKRDGASKLRGSAAKKRRERRRRDRTEVSEDEDVDDLDALQFGRAEESDEDEEEDDDIPLIALKRDVQMKERPLAASDADITKRSADGKDGALEEPRDVATATKQ